MSSDSFYQCVHVAAEVEDRSRCTCCGIVKCRAIGRYRRALVDIAGYSSGMTHCHRYLLLSQPSIFTCI